MLLHHGLALVVHEGHHLHLELLELLEHGHLLLLGHLGVPLHLNHLLLHLLHPHRHHLLLLLLLKPALHRLPHLLLLLWPTHHHLRLLLLLARWLKVHALPGVRSLLLQAGRLSLSNSSQHPRHGVDHRLCRCIEV